MAGHAAPRAAVLEGKAEFGVLRRAPGTPGTCARRAGRPITVQIAVFRIGNSMFGCAKDDDY